MEQQKIEEGTLWRWTHGEGGGDSLKYVVLVIAMDEQRVWFRRKSNQKLHELSLEWFRKMFVPLRPTVFAWQ